MEVLKLEIIKKALIDKSAFDIKVINVEEYTPFFSYYIICSVKNVRQANACINEIKDKLEQSNIEFNDKKGVRESSWSILDLGDILVHIFLEEERKNVSLEELLEKEKKVDED